MPDSGYNKGKVSLLALAHLITDIYPGFLAPIIPLLMVKLNFTITKAAILNSSLTFSASLLQPVFGYFSDKIKKVYFLVIGPILAAFFMSFIGLPHNYYLLLLFVLLAGTGVACFHPQGAALTNIQSGPRKSKGLGLFVLGGGLGVALGALLIAIIVSVGGLPAASYAVLPGFIIAGFLYKCFHKESIINTTAKNNTFSTKTAVVFIIILIQIAIVRAVVILGLSVFLPIFLAEQGKNVAYGGLTLFLLHAFGALGGFCGGQFSEKVGAKVVILFSFLLPIPVFYFYLSCSGPLSLVLICLGAFFLYAAIPIVISLGQDTLPNKIGMISSMMMGLCWGIAGLIIIALGAIADVIGVEVTLHYLIYGIIVGFFLGLSLLKVKLPDSRH